MAAALLGAAAPVGAQAPARDVSAQSLWPDALEVQATLDSAAPVRLEAMASSAEAPFVRVDADRRGGQVVARIPTNSPHVPAGSLLRVRWLIDGVPTGWTNLRYDDNRFAWTASSDRFITVWTHPGSSARAGPVLAEAGRVAAAYERSFGYALDRPLNVVVYASAREMEPALDAEARAVRGSASGLAYPAFGVVHVADDSRGSGLAALGHDVAHVITERAARRDLRRLPAWLDEGISTALQSSGGAEYADVLREAARAGMLLPLEMQHDLPIRGSDRALLYATGSGVVRHMTDRYGQGRTSAMMRLLGQGASVEAAVEQGLGAPLDRVEADWRASLGVAPPPAVDYRLSLAGAVAALVAILGASVLVWRRRR